jgi:hypothetical protein
MTRDASTLPKTLVGTSESQMLGSKFKEEDKAHWTRIAKLYSKIYHHMDWIIMAKTSLVK